MSSNDTPRRPPAAVRRELRQEANFGCVVCGAPVIQYHHIVPYSEREHNNPEDMVVLCPNHHHHAGPDAEALTPDQLYEYKRNPHNTDTVSYDFFYESEMPLIQFAGNYFAVQKNNHMTILAIDEEPIIEIWFENGLLEFSTKLYDRNGTLAAEIDRNEWIAYTDLVWDLEYRPNYFVIRHEPQDIGLEVEYNSDDDLISMRQSFYYGGAEITGTPSKLNVPGAMLKENKFIDTTTAIQIRSQEEGFSVGLG